MSAIFGIVRFDGTSAGESAMQRMSNQLARRGPDGRKFVTSGPAGLGHALMRVNQEDTFEAQPLRDAKAGLVLVADCRIDNREELAAQLGIPAGDQAATPDSAFILRAYQRWGEDCCAHLIGDFAFAIWDERKRTLFAARDHMGQRTLFYHLAKDFIAFATEINALWCVPDVPREVAEDEIVRYLTFAPAGRPQGGTFFKDIFGLGGGMSLTADAEGRMQKRRYWEPGPVAEHENRDEAYYIERYRSLLGEAVACRFRRLISPPAILFSAGYDTAAIAGLAGPVLAAQGRRLLACSAVVPERLAGTRWDIRPWINACARVMPHLDVRPIEERAASPLLGLEESFAQSNGPPPFRSLLNHACLVEAAGGGSRLIVDGIGGDYTVNPRGHAALARLLRQGRFGAFLSELRPHIRLTGQSPWQTLRTSIVAPLMPPRLVRWAKSFQDRSSFDRDQLPVTAATLERSRAAGAANPREDTPRTAMRDAIVSLARSVAKAAGPGMETQAAAHRLEFTRPFHDKRVVEFGLSVPEDLYVRQGRNRYLACVALRDIYPPEFQTRSRENDPTSPDYVANVDANLAEVRALAARLQQREKICDYVDFAKLDALLNTGRSRGRARLNIAMALHALRIARYVDWFSQPN